MSTDKAPISLPIGYVEKKFVDAMLGITESLQNVDADWSLGGDVADAMRGVDIRPEYAELFTNEDGARKLHEVLWKYRPTELKLTEQRSSRDAHVNGTHYPVYLRSHFFECMVGDVRVKVHGDLQFKVGEWEWGDIIEYNPEPLYLVGVKVSIVPLTFRLELYRNLGWTDRVDAINAAVIKASEHQGWHTLD